jgi:hypothetical protein
MRGVSWRTEGSKENLNRRRQRWTKGNQDRRSGMGLQQIPVWACNNLTFMCGAAPRLAFCLPPHHTKPARSNATPIPSFPLLPSVQVLFSPSVRNQDWPSGITSGSHKLANYAFVSFATFCSSPLLPFCKKTEVAFRDHHWLAQTRKLCLRFLCYLLFKSSSPLL